jgi:hypothetical protein
MDTTTETNAHHLALIIITEGAMYRENAARGKFIF